ncbi:YbaB/EbfC family nucleoid-associated protein [Selenomonas sp. F0473]|uniref:YbaB/EbfC family nucleoid-associated protein n=1 Tax=Selenomonas sp. F0473 TaxID=999423 RepID=UPI00029EB685|nr:YbaB/EbfC family nucleoid-associated protein [Selenomonas sp. F0473]EKU70951.1 YbaB/EbfC family DNA-binding protein [Selenomonas sp. F0473]
MFNGGGNMAGMMKKVQKMQNEMKKMQDDLKKRTVEVSSGGGAVKIVMDGEKQVQNLVIAPAAVDPEDIEMLQDLLSAAFNEATKKVDEMMAAEMGKLTSGLGLPPGLL